MRVVLEPFEIRVGDPVLDDLERRLARTRLPEDLGGDGWDYGTPAAYLRELLDYWQRGYDWREQEARLNELPQFQTFVDGTRIHYVHARSGRDDALPLLIVHGWPGSIVEFLDVIPRLAGDGAGSAAGRQVFDVVAPSLPGYGLSGPTPSRGWGVARTAAAFVELMRRLGYDRYGVQGGDWGAQVATRVATLDPEHCAAIHLNMAFAHRPERHVELTAEDQADLAAMARFARDESAYAHLHSTKPQSLGVALEDSPAGLLAWIIEKFRTWSDCGGSPETVFTRDQLLTNVMLYWVTGTAASSLRLYWELQHSDEGPPPYVSVPTGVARYPKEVIRFPRAWVEASYNVTRWEEMPRGGHFAAMEQPEIFVQDVRQFFAEI